MTHPCPRFRVGRRADAAALYASAARAWPGLAEAHVNLARLLGLEGRADEARAALERARAANPDSAAAHRLLAQLLQEEGDAAGAIPHFQAAVRIAEANAELHENLGLSLAGAGRVDEALAEFQEALRLAPDWPAALERVALLLASDPDPRHRNPAEAIRLAERAVRLTHDADPTALEVAAASYAAANRFSDAEASQAKVVELATRRGAAPLAAAARDVLELYRRRLPLPGLPRREGSTPP